MSVTETQSGTADGPRARRTGPLVDVAVVLGCYLALGVACGVVWWLLVQPALFTKVHGGGTMSELQLGKEFNGDGWYSVIAAVAGICSGLALTWWRSRNYLLTTLLLVPGSALAATVMALVGRTLGPESPKVAIAAAKVGQHIPDQVAVHAWASYLVWPMGALVGSLGVLWSSSRGNQEDRSRE